MWLGSLKNETSNLREVDLVFTMGSTIQIDHIQSFMRINYLTHIFYSLHSPHTSSIHSTPHKHSSSNQDVQPVHGNNLLLKFVNIKTHKFPLLHKNDSILVPYHVVFDLQR